MPFCMFYSCKDEGITKARFADDTGHTVEGHVCPAHDRYSQQGGELAILYHRVLDRPTLIGYNETPQPPTGG